MIARSSTSRAVISNTVLDNATFILRFERGGLSFEPGQYLSVGPQGELNRREYSIYSGTDDEWLEILVKIVDGGYVSPRLAKLVPGDHVIAEGPFGFFTMNKDIRHKKHVFIASGTGISPFHAQVRSQPDLDYLVLHGTKTSAECFGHEAFSAQRLVTCTSQEAGAGYHGRVTGWLQEHEVDLASMFWLCGNCDMIYETYDLLRSRNVPAAAIHAEVYF